VHWTSTVAREGYKAIILEPKFRAWGWGLWAGSFKSGVRILRWVWLVCVGLMSQPPRDTRKWAGGLGLVSTPRLQVSVVGVYSKLEERSNSWSG
jgi:hypothetical protein